MTITGLILIPVALACACLDWRVFLPFLFACSMLTPAAVFNRGTIGLQPVYFVDLLLIARTLTEVVLLRTPLNMFIFRQIAPLSLFFSWSVIALLISIIVFDGKIRVVGGTDAFLTDFAQPYHFRRENITQLAYLAINVFVVYCLAHQISRLSWSEGYQILTSSLVLAIILSEIFVIWQIISVYTGIPFPEAFVYSNAGYARSAGQMMVGILRVSGPFDEPATLGYFFTGFSLFCWIRYRNRGTLSGLLLFISCVIVLLVSTSTTAYVGLAIILVALLRDITSGRGLTPFGNGKIRRRGFISFFTVLGAALVVGSYAAFHWDSVEAIYNATVADKLQSSSFYERRGVDVMAIEIFGQTAGIGIGLGSHKPNSLIMTIISNTGIIGCATIGVFLFFLLVPGWSTALKQRGEIKAIAPFQAMVFGLLLVHSFSNPNLSMGIFWLSSGSVLGLLAALHLNQTRSQTHYDTAKGGWRQA